MDSDDQNPDDAILHTLIENARSGDSESARTLLWHILGLVADEATARPNLREYADEARRRITQDESYVDALNLRRKKNRPKSPENAERDFCLACLVKTQIYDTGSTIEDAVLTLSATPNFPFNPRMLSRAYDRFGDQVATLPAEVQEELIAFFVQ